MNQRVPPAERVLIPGPVGALDTLIDWPLNAPKGIALVCHPHPLFGGAAENKVAQVLAKTLRDLGYVALRPNFRGVAGSEGSHDEGEGETDDMLVVLEWAQKRLSDASDTPQSTPYSLPPRPALDAALGASSGQPSGESNGERSEEPNGESKGEPTGIPVGLHPPVVLAGYSFGAYVQTRVAKRLKEAGHSAQRIVLVGTAAGHVTGARHYETEAVPKDTIVIHGDVDETVALANVLAWATPMELPVVVIPGADHFFHRKLHIIRDIVADAWKP